MHTTIIIVEKGKDGSLSVIDERPWSAEWITLLNHTNYLILNGNEYEMLEGRLNIDTGVMELLVISAQKP